MTVTHRDFCGSFMLLLLNRGYMCNLLHAIIACNLLHAINCTCNHGFSAHTGVLWKAHSTSCRFFCNVIGRTERTAYTDVKLPAVTDDEGSAVVQPRAEQRDFHLEVDIVRINGWLVVAGQFPQETFFHRPSWHLSHQKPRRHRLPRDAPAISETVIRVCRMGATLWNRSCFGGTLPIFTGEDNNQQLDQIFITSRTYGTVYGRPTCVADAGIRLYFNAVVSSVFCLFRHLFSAVGDWMSTILPHMVWP